MQFHSGESAAVMHDKYPVLYHQATRRAIDAYQAKHPQRELWFFTRSGYDGSAAFEGGNFPGDGLESIYGAADPALYGNQRRLGVLGLSGLLAARSGPAGSDPVKRGIMVRVELLCEAMPPPIPDADFGKVAVTEDMQTRERFEALAAIPACKSCHDVINPPGYSFEEFDQLGRYRNMEKGRPVNAVGTISPYFGAEPYAGVEVWDGIVPLARWLSQSKEARACFATHFASYVLTQAVPQGTQNCSLATWVA